MCSGRGSSRSVADTLKPSAPLSPRKRPVRSGPPSRVKGLAPLRPPEPVVTREPSASTTVTPMTLSATVPWVVEPKKALFCESAPPTVATRPESGPQ